jgi:hypothetical protein
MPKTEYVKMIFDGQVYWLLWHWNKRLTPTRLKTSYAYASGPFECVTEAEKEVIAGWTLIPYQS